jgi:hypothetical protein
MWYERVQSIVSSGELQNDQDRSVLSGRGLNERIRRHGVESEKCALEKGWHGPGDGATEDRCA